MKRPSARLVRRLLAFALLPVLLLCAANAFMVLRAHGRHTHDLAALPHAQVAIVPGALVRADGQMSPALSSRVAGAVRLYDAGLVDKILVSGDHGKVGYDETDTMREAVLAAGVPPQAVFTDYAGFDTWATMSRARRIFGVDSAIVVTQQTFAARAIELGRAAGLEIHGLDVGGITGRKGKELHVRELVARVKGLEQATFHPGVTGGPRLPISGDGRVSWGPADPSGGSPTPSDTE